MPTPVGKNRYAPVRISLLRYAILMSAVNSTQLQVPFLNLMANIVARAGWVQVRVGGNSQDTAELVASLPNGTVIAKDLNNTSNPTGTPPIEYTTDLLQMMENISKLTNVYWYLGWFPIATFPPSLKLIHPRYCLRQQSEYLTCDRLKRSEHPWRPYTWFPGRK